jgi:hypothetical protein
MGQAISPSTNRPYGLERVCKVWGIARASIYRRLRQPGTPPQKRGPKPSLEEAELLERIRKDLKASPFKGERHRKVHARLRRAGGCCRRTALPTGHQIHMTGASQRTPQTLCGDRMERKYRL